MLILNRQPDPNFKIFQRSPKLLEIAEKIKSKCFLDIGANHGYYSIKVASLLPDCKIYAFEPLSRNVEFIKENIRLNKLENIEIVKNVVSRESKGILCW